METEGEIFICSEITRFVNEFHDGEDAARGMVRTSDFDPEMTYSKADFKEMIRIGNLVDRRLNSIAGELAQHPIHRTKSPFKRKPGPSDIIADALNKLSKWRTTAQAAIGSLEETSKRLGNRDLKGWSNYNELCAQLYLHLKGSHYRGKKADWRVIWEIVQILQDNNIKDTTRKRPEEPDYDLYGDGKGSFVPSDTPIGKRLDRIFKDSGRQWIIKDYSTTLLCPEYSS